MDSGSRQVVEEFWAPFEVGAPTGEAAQAWKDRWATDGVWEMPFAPDPLPKVIEGQKVIGHFADWLFAIAPDLRVVELSIEETKDPALVLMEVRLTSTLADSGRPYANTYCSLMRIVDGKIKLFREYFDPTVVLDAFGVDGLEKGLGQVMAAAAAD
jgi:ketosteroid isomerase-like protein